MKYFGLIWKNVWRKKIRTSLTILSVLVAFLLFFLLSAIGKALTASRLVVIHKVSLIKPLPISYMTKIAAVPGVDKVSHATWFGGYYQDPKNQFGQFPIETEEYRDRIRRVIHGTDGQHRFDCPADPRRRVLHLAVRHRQHDGAVGPRAY